MSFTFLKQLPSPGAIKEQFPLSAKAVETKKWLSQNALQKHFATAIFVGGRTVF